MAGQGKLNIWPINKQIQHTLDLCADARIAQHSSVKENRYGRFCHENHLKPRAIANVNAFERQKGFAYL